MAMEIDSSSARVLFEEGGILVAVGAPRGTYFGVDLQCWRIDSEFRGIKMIPPGLHFVHYSASDLSSGDDAPRMGFIHNFKKREILLKMWDKEKEDFSDRIVDEETIERFRDNLYNMDKYLAPYPYEIFRKWLSLSSNITETLVDKLTPENGRIRSALELVSCNDKDRPKGEKRIIENSSKEVEDKPAGKSSDGPTADYCDISQVDENRINSDVLNNGCIKTNVAESETKRKTRNLTIEEKEEALLPDLKPTPGTFLRFTSFPDRKFPVNASPSEITKHYLDQTYVLDLMIQSHQQPIDIIGELEFAYICFLIGHSLEAFEYWKKLVSLLCSCEIAITKYRNVYMNFITTLQVQLMEIPEEFLSDIVINENVIYVMLRNFFKTVHSTDIESRLKTAIERFQYSLTERFMWNFSNLDNDEDDELPVIVHL